MYLLYILSCRNDYGIRPQHELVRLLHYTVFMHSNKTFAYTRMQLPFIMPVCVFAIHHQHLPSRRRFKVCSGFMGHSISCSTSVHVFLRQTLFLHSCPCCSRRLLFGKVWFNYVSLSIHPVSYRLGCEPEEYVLWRSQKPSFCRLKAIIVNFASYPRLRTI